MSLPLASSAPLPSSTAAQGIGKTAGEFLSQWRNPNDVLSILLIIGGSTVRTALAQLAGNSTFVPVCFSFGWVAFSFENIVSMAGEGRLMPNPDYPCKVINAESGYARENRSWMLGRLLRDNEEPLNEEALCISIWHAKRGNEGTRKAGHSDQRSWIFLMNAAMIVVQLAIAAIPWGIYGDWSVFVVTTAGTVLALSTGALPQWRAEKLSCRSNESKKDILITRGIGTRHVLLIIGNGASLDFEDIAGGDSPRSYRIWKNHRKLNAMADYTNSSTPSAEKSFSLAPRITGRSEPYKPGDLPLPFWFTRIMTVLFAGLWICLLISVAGLQLNAWFLLLVGAIGMVQNSFVAGFRQNLRASGLYFDTQETPIKKNKVMHALMQLETQYPNAGLCLLSEFFPGELRPGEEAWWDAARFNMRFRKYQTALEKGKSPDMPDWSPWLTKYKSRLRWLEICKKEYNPAPFTQIPEQPGESTTGEGAATSGMLEASGSGTMRAAAMPTDP